MGDKMDTIYIYILSMFHQTSSYFYLLKQKLLDITKIVNDLSMTTNLYNLQSSHLRNHGSYIDVK